MLVTASCALLAAVLYGIADFGSSLAARRIRVFPATVITYCFGSVVVLVVVPATGGVWSLAAVLWGGAAGVFTVVGLLAFYTALAAGSMSLMSALIAALESLVPVLAAILAGQRLAWWAWLAIGAAVVGGVLLSRERPDGTTAVSPRTARLAIISGLTLGASVLSLDAAPRDGRIIPAGAETVIGLVLLGVLALLARLRLTGRPARAMLSVLAEPVPVARPAFGSNTVVLAGAGGALLATANILLVIALHSGSLAVAGVLVSLYPLSTILLARLVLREPLTRSQVFGIALALLACVLLSQA